MYLGNYNDVRKAINELFPGKNAYTDDNQIVSGLGHGDHTLAVISVHKSGQWAITTWKRGGSETTRVLAVPSARATNNQSSKLPPVVHFRLRRHPKKSICKRWLTQAVFWTEDPELASCRHCLWKLHRPQPYLESFPLREKRLLTAATRGQTVRARMAAKRELAKLAAADGFRAAEQHRSKKSVIKDSQKRSPHQLRASARSRRGKHPRSK